jgi:4'-phosphopantetheinyl transferase
MSSDRDVPVPSADGKAADGEPAVTVWLAGPAAGVQFTPAAQTAEDLARWREIKNPKRREEWEVSRALLAHVRATLGMSPSSANPQGVATSLAGSEPERPRDRVPPSGDIDRAAFSLSHSGGFAAVAASRVAVRVGVDLECARARDAERLARFAFSEREQAQLEALSTEAKAERFYILWTLKEAFAKALSLPLMVSLSRCTFHEEPGGEWRGSVPADGAWVARVFRPAPTLVLSVAALLPEGIPPGNVSVSVSEWPTPAAQSWRTLATLHSGSA